MVAEPILHAFPVWIDSTLLRDLKSLPTCWARIRSKRHLLTQLFPRPFFLLVFGFPFAQSLERKRTKFLAKLSFDCRHGFAHRMTLPVFRSHGWLLKFEIHSVPPAKGTNAARDLQQIDTSLICKWIIAMFDCNAFAWRFCVCALCWSRHTAAVASKRLKTWNACSKHSSASSSSSCSDPSAHLAHTGRDLCCSQSQLSNWLVDCLRVLLVVIFGCRRFLTRFLSWLVCCALWFMLFDSVCVSLAFSTRRLLLLLLWAVLPHTCPSTSAVVQGRSNSIESNHFDWIDRFLHSTHDQSHSFRLPNTRIA